MRSARRTRCSIASVAAVCGRLGCHVNPMQVRWCANGLARQHYGTGHPGPQVVLEWSSPWRRRRSERSWPPGANQIWSAVASQRNAGRQRFLFHSCSWGGCQMVRTVVDMEKAPRVMPQRHAATLVWGALLPLHKLRERVAKAVWVKRGD